MDDDNPETLQFKRPTWTGKLDCHLPLENGIVKSWIRGTIQIDGAGRVVLPKPVRDKFNLAPGDKLRFCADENGIHLEPVASGGQLVRKGSALVFRGEFAKLVTTEMISRLVEEDRDHSAEELRAKPGKR